MSPNQPLPCSDCGNLGPSRAEMEEWDADVAIHDCEADDWMIYKINIPPNVAALNEKIRAERAKGFLPQ